MSDLISKPATDSSTPRGRHSASSLRARKRRTGGSPITALTVYDAAFAKLFDAEVDVLLVGDSLGMAVQGHSNTLSVTMEQALYHTRCVVTGSKRAHIVADMPFMSYQASVEEAVRNAGRLIAEGGAQSIKLEGGRTMAAAVRRIVDCGIPVMGHVGMTPQSVNQFGGFKVQGKDVASAEAILQDALAIQNAGAYAVVLEAIPESLADVITSELDIPTIGIGASAKCDGQVLVMHDVLGLDLEFKPRFAKRYADLGERAQAAARQFTEEVRSGVFPDSSHVFRLAEK